MHQDQEKTQVKEHGQKPDLNDRALVEQKGFRHGRFRFP
jgi:hypothetical protein